MLSARAGSILFGGPCFIGQVNTYEFAEKYYAAGRFDLFLYGIKLMGDGLNLAAGNKLEEVIDSLKLIKNETLAENFERFRAKYSIES